MFHLRHGPYRLKLLHDAELIKYDEDPCPLKQRTIITVKPSVILPKITKKQQSASPPLAKTHRITSALNPIVQIYDQDYQVGNVTYDFNDQ
jgi:hypothetical protein